MFAVLFALLVAQVQTQPQTLSLDDAVKMALDRNTDLRKQALLSMSAEQDRLIARARVLPTVDLQVSGGPYRINGTVLVSGGIPLSQSATGTSYYASLTVQQVIFDGSKWWNTLAANEGANSAQAQVDEQRLQITYLVEQRFLEMVRAQRQLTVLSEAAARSRDQADFTQRLFEGGRASQADVYAARANRDNDEVNRLGQERTVELARADLTTAIGLDPGSTVAVVEPTNLTANPAQPPALAEAVQKALSTRPSLKAAALTVEQNKDLITASKGGYLPNLAIVGQWQRSTSDFATLHDRPDLNSQMSAALVLNWNLFAGLGTNAASQKAALQAQLAENDFEAGRRGVANDVEKAVAQLAAAGAQARVAQQAESTAKEGLRLAKTRQEVGVGTQLEVRDAELKLTQAQLNVVGSLVDGREAEAALRRAVGG